MNILRLHADNADCRVNGFNRNRDTGNSAAAANGHDDIIHVIQIF